MRCTRVTARCKLALACALAFGLPAAAWSTPILGAAQSFTILGGSAVTNTGPTSIHGDIGVAPGTAVTGTGAGSTMLTGAVHSNDTAAAQAHADAIAASSYLSSLLYTADLSGKDLGGMTLTAGVYRISSSAQLTGTLTLDAQNMANALFVFQIGSTLTTANASAVSIVNGGADTGVFFGVGTSAVLGTESMFAGNIIAAESITMNGAASLLCGRALAINGAVTLDTNLVSNNCAAEGNFGTGRRDNGSQGFSGVVAAQAVPEPSSLLLLPFGLALLVGTRSRRRTA